MTRYRLSHHLRYRVIESPERCTLLCCQLVFSARDALSLVTYAMSSSDDAPPQKKKQTTLQCHQTWPREITDGDGFSATFDDTMAATNHPFRKEKIIYVVRTRPPKKNVFPIDPP